MLSQLLFSLGGGAHAAPFAFAFARQLARLPHAAIVVGSREGVEARAESPRKYQYLTPQRFKT